MHDLILLDSDNLAWADLRPLIEGAVSLVPSPEPVREVRLRVYGGWWDGALPTDARIALAGRLPELSPALLRVDTSLCRVSSEFADQLLGDPPFRNELVRDTYVRRPLDRIAVKSQPSEACDNPQCQLRQCRDWVRTRRACSLRDCTKRFGDYWLRPEQKKVDVHIAVDAMLAAIDPRGPLNLVIASDDHDLEPALQAIRLLLRPPRMVSRITSASLGGTP